MELPPRARRIRASSSPIGGANGTTSACAENTGQNTSHAPMSWNYLRVRGEYWSGMRWITDEAELPPRARRIPPTPSRTDRTLGTTSACAENTGKEVSIMSNPRNYLRVRGEYPK